MKINDLATLNEVRRQGLESLVPNRPRIAIGLGTCGIGNGAEEVREAFLCAADEKGIDVLVANTGCLGFCADEPMVNIAMPGKPLIVLSKVRPRDAGPILEDVHRGVPPKRRVLCKIEEWDHLSGGMPSGETGFKSVISYGVGYPDIPHWYDIPFYRGQKKIVLRNCGLIDPTSIEEYIATGGYLGLYRALHQMAPEKVIDEVRAAKLRGRGGAGFLTATKWDFMRRAADETRYVICNADEGDPGAYMNRNEIESDPHSLIEGVTIGAYAMGATEGIVYVRAEYPLAVHRLEKAIVDARAMGLLGEDIMGSGFNFDIRLVEGAGAFVCGEETAMIASLEGQQGRPKPRPPFPAEKGLWGHPTNINNVETWYNIPVIINNGGNWFLNTGTDSSPGTKVFSLVGKVKNTGLVEMPLGTPLKSFVYDVGGGTGNNKAVKAVQTGGPSGGCIPVDLFESSVDYESLAALGSIMGSGGMVVMDEDNCMVDVARYFIEFTHSESCGKCVPCRVGLDHALRILNDITEGRGTIENLDTLDDLGRMIRDASLCGLGQTAPNPVLTTLRFFRHEYEEHILQKWCSAGVCEGLFLSPCENSCPLHMNIPQFIQLYKENRMEDAFESILLDNPLPASTGRVCQHQCEDRCTRAGIDKAVNIRDAHRYIADVCYDSEVADTVRERILSRKLPASGKRVAVVGAGPTGLSAAFYLVLLGHDVTVFEGNPEAGGMLRYAQPEYRLPKAVIAKEVAFIESLGVKFQFNTRIGVDMSPKDLCGGYDSAFLALGTWEPVPVDFPGVRCAGVYNALEFLDATLHGKQPEVGKKVIVVGGGYAAVDSARTLLRLGCDVTIAYRRDRSDMLATPRAIQEAEEEGVKFECLMTPHRIIADGKGWVKAMEFEKTEMAEFGGSGRRKPSPTGEIVRISCETVILAVGKRVDSVFTGSTDLDLNRDGTIKVNRYTAETTEAGVYAGGDVVTGASRVSIAMGQGKHAAQMIDLRLMGESRFEKLFPVFTYSRTAPDEAAGGKRNLSPKAPAHERAKNFSEVALGFSGEQASLEVNRCMRCDACEK